MKIFRAFARWHRYRTTVYELNKLSTRELNDIGITRSQIPTVAIRATRRS